MNKESEHAGKFICTRCGTDFTLGGYRRRKCCSDDCRKISVSANQSRNGYRKNPERAKEYFRKYRAADPERHREHSRNYRAKNLERCRERNRIYYAKNRERCRARSRNYQSANPGRCAGYSRRRRLENPDLMRAYMETWKRNRRTGERIFQLIAAIELIMKGTNENLVTAAP